MSSDLFHYYTFQVHNLRIPYQHGIDLNFFHVFQVGTIPYKLLKMFFYRYLLILKVLGFYGLLGNNPNITTPSESTNTGKKTFSTACTESCPPGKHGKSLGQYNVDTGCEDCEPGKYNNEKGQMTCENQCRPGKYGPKPGGKIEENSCHLCEMGKYNGEKGKSSCKGCPKGKYEGSTKGMRDAKKCTCCKQGVYNDQEGQNHCQGCGNMTTPLGKESSNTKALSYFHSLDNGFDLPGHCKPLVCNMCIS
jgi:hypothetical protein